jgi:nucleotide-binding universal stress UspA family protein
MGYKTIVVHLSDKRRAEAVLAPAAELATRFGSHLTGVHVTTVIPAPRLPTPFATQALDKIAAGARDNAEAIARTFARVTAEGRYVSEWQFLEVPHVDLVSKVLEGGRTADLIVAGQTDPGWDLAPLLDFPERLALEAGRPVLVVPYANRRLQTGRNIVIAWKPTREAARAVFDALPLLTAADRVHILEFKDTSETTERSTSGTSIAATLGRHGIKPTVHSKVAPDSTVGDEILSFIDDVDADLLVMGIYGHSRMRELVFGGTTRHIARNMRVPTLFSH